MLKIIGKDKPTDTTFRRGQERPKEVRKSRLQTINCPACTISCAPASTRLLAPSYSSRRLMKIKASHASSTGRAGGVIAPPAAPVNAGLPATKGTGNLECGTQYLISGSRIGITWACHHSLASHAHRVRLRLRGVDDLLPAHQLSVFR